MIMYPTTLLFQITRTVERALSALKAGKPMPAKARWTSTPSRTSWACRAGRRSRRGSERGDPIRHGTDAERRHALAMRQSGLCSHAGAIMGETRDSIADIWGDADAVSTGRLAGPGRRADDRGARALGASRPACSAPTAAGWTSASRTAGSSACAGGPTTGSTAAGSGPRGCTAGRRTTAADRLTRPLDPPRRQAPRGELGRGDGPDRRRSRKEIRDEYTGGAIGFYNTGPALPRGVLHARRDRQGRARHAAHGRQHPALHGDRRARR